MLSGDGCGRLDPCRNEQFRPKLRRRRAWTIIGGDKGFAKQLEFAIDHE